MKREYGKIPIRSDGLEGRLLVDPNIWAPVTVAFINMLGSVLIMWIRARYSFHESTNGTNGGRSKTDTRP